MKRNFKTLKIYSNLEGMFYRSIRKRGATKTQAINTFEEISKKFQNFKRGYLKYNKNKFQRICKSFVAEYFLNDP